MTNSLRARHWTDVFKHLRIMPNFLGVGIDLNGLIRDIRRTESNIDEQVQDALQALAKSSTLIHELETALHEREKKLEFLKIEHERISNLSTLTDSQAQAVASSLEKIVGRVTKRERLFAIVINLAVGLLIFFLGILASDWVARVVS